MSDCANGGRGRWTGVEWHEPLFGRENTLVQQPQYPKQLYEHLTAIEICGIRFERVEKEVGE